MERLGSVHGLAQLRPQLLPGSRWRKMLVISDPFTEVKARRPRLVLGWLTAGEDWALLTWVRSSVWT